MSTLTTQLPAHRADLVIRPIGEQGRYVVKDPGTREYFELGRQEHFLLTQLDGERDAAEICAAFECEFDESLSEDDLDGFLAMARGQQLLENAKGETEKAEHAEDKTASKAAPAAPRPRQSILYWRKSIFDPDRLFNWLEPRIRFFWTRAFLVLSSGSILLALLVVWSSREAVATSFASALRWETIVLTWLTTMIVVTLHEFAHGLTCKHYGGEVREIGFLLMFFMPCFYCNVSDAWLFREKSKRLWVTFAGGYFELFLWSLAVFVWRITMPDSLVNYLAFLVMSVAGIQSFFNFNPLIKLDGYYLLSDWLEVPNLRQRSWQYLMARLRRLLWGGPRLASPPRAGFLLGYGLASWLFSLLFVTLMLVGMVGWLRVYLGGLSLLAVGGLGLVSARGLLGGLFQKEFLTMLRQRHARKLVWSVALAAIVAAAFLVPWPDQATGEFEVRARTHVELRAPVAGFLQRVNFDEGEHVPHGREIARLHIPDLESRITQKRSELREAEAKLRLLQAGPRAEDIAQQERRVAAALAWRDVARQNLERQRKSLDQEMVRFDKLLDQHQADCDYAEQKLATLTRLRNDNVTSQDEYLAVKKAYLVACARREQTEADKRSSAALGASAAEMELAEREAGLAHEQATLTLLKAGTRPEEIEAAEATVARLREELAYLEAIDDRLTIRSPVEGVITTGRLKEKVGDYFDEGELICEIEDDDQLEVVIALSEDQAARIQQGQRVCLKARSLPFEVFEVDVYRVAPRAESGDAQSKVKIYCRLDDPDARLRSGMTGYARITCGHDSLAVVLARNCLRYLRTEFWW